MRVSVAYEFLPKTPSVHASLVMDHFGVGFDTGRHIIAENLELPIQAGDIVLFTGASGSGKSSLLRAAAAQLDQKPRGRAPAVLADDAPTGRSPSASVLNIDDLDLGERILVDGLGLPAKETFALLTSCGLGEARLMLRTPRELSDGQRYRYRLALAFSQSPAWIIADEFTATLDRTLARVIAFNLGKTARRRHAGLLLATTHEDIAEDLQPDVHVRCGLDGTIDVRKTKTADAIRGFGGVKKKVVSFADAIELTTGTKRDWPYFARWHYRSHRLGFVRRVTVLWHGEEPIGICVFTTPPKSLKQRTRYFGLSGKWSKWQLQALNAQVAMLSRVVLHPTYRGAGLAADFIRASCRSCPWPWIETLTEMGHFHPFFEKAGFVRVGVSSPACASRIKHSAIYVGRSKGKQRRQLLSAESHEKSRYAEPVYYVFDNRVDER